MQTAHLLDLIYLQLQTYAHSYNIYIDTYMVYTYVQDKCTWTQHFPPLAMDTCSLICKLNWKGDLRLWMGRNSDKRGEGYERQQQYTRSKDKIIKNLQVLLGRSAMDWTEVGGV